MTLAYEGEVLFAHHNPGDTPYLLVTFIGLYREHVADSLYLMQALVEREGIACIGVTTRLRTFYLHPEMEEIAALVRSIQQPNQKIIVVGQSSAGYAAVKFANLLKADYVLAFSPIFSAHEVDLGFAEGNEREIAFLRGALRAHRIDMDVVRPGMRPGPEDCSAPLFIMYDPANESDAWAAECYARIIPQTRLMRCPDLGHEVFERIYEEQGHHLAVMLGRLAIGNENAAYSWLQYLSRRSESAVASLMVRIARWRPWMIETALRTERAREVLTEKTKQRHQFNDIAVFEYIRHGRVTDALAHLRGLHQGLFGDQPDPASPDATSPGTFLVLSYHGDLLKYDSEASKAVMMPQGLFDQQHAPLLLDTRSGEPQLMLQMRSGPRPVVLDRDSAERNGASFEIVPLPETGLVAFRRGNTFLTADYAAAPTFTAPRLQGWEQFALVPVSRPTAFTKLSGSSWFDQISTAVVSNQDERPALAPRRTSFRTKLQRFFN